MNEAFSGLNLAAVANISSYMHFRLCHQADKMSNSERNNGICVEYFLKNNAKVKHHGYGLLPKIQASQPAFYAPDSSPDLWIPSCEN